MKPLLTARLAAPLLAVVLAGCSTSSPAPGSEAGERTRGEPLRVGVAPDYPPLIFKQDGRIVGLEADMARAMGRQLNRPVVLVEKPWTDLISSLLNGEVDVIMSGMSITPERQVRIVFSKPYLKVGQLLLMRRADADKYPSIDSLQTSGVRIGVQKGTTGEQLLRQGFPSARKAVYLSASDAALDLVRNRIDFLLHDAPMVWWLASENEADLMALDRPLSEEYLAWGVRRDSQPLLEKMNHALAVWQSSGTLDYLLNRWLPYMP